MVKNKDLQRFLDEYYNGDSTKVSRIEISSDEFPLSEEPEVNLITEGKTFWQLDDLSKDSMPNLKELCLVDEPVFGAVEVANLDFCMVVECPHVNITIRNISYDIRGTRKKAWIYEYKDGKAIVTRE